MYKVTSKAKQSSDSNRVVVTGLGIVSSLGVGRLEFWDALTSGNCGIKPIKYFDTSELPTHRGGEIDWTEKKSGVLKYSNNMGMASRYAHLALTLAMQDAGLSKDRMPIYRSGVCLGTTMGEIQSLEYLNDKLIKREMDTVNKYKLIGYPAASIASNLSKYLGIHGTSMMYTTACASGNYAIGRAFDLIKSGKNDVVIAGGVDSISRLNIIGFSRLFAMAPEVCQPFDKNRKGMMVGEGAGILILESLEHARLRNAEIYSEMFDYSLSCDAHHMVEPHKSGIAKCITKLLNRNNLLPQDIDYICAHGTGTKANDRTEGSVIHDIFYSKGHRVPVSSIKSMIGHTMGAASAMETIACCLAIKNSIIPPTINFETPDPECPIDCVPNIARKAILDRVLNNSFAFGGNNASILLGKII